MAASRRRLPALGPLTAFHAQTRYRGPGEVLDELLEDLLHHLEPEPVPFEAALDDLLDLADTIYQCRSPYLQNPDHRRTAFRYDLDLLTHILGWAGIVERADATVQPDRWGHRDRLVDGTLTSPASAAGGCRTDDPLSATALALAPPLSPS